MRDFCSLIEKRFCRKVFGNSKRDRFPNYLTYTCVNDAYSDFIYRFAEAINFISPSKKIRVKTKLKFWFDNQIMSAIQREG